MEVDMSDEVADDTMIVFCCGGVCPNWACCCCCCCCCWGCGWFLLYADNWDIGNDSWDGVMNNDCWPIGGGCCDRPYPKFDWLNYKWHQVDKLIITYMHIAFQYLWFFKSFSLFAHLYFTDMYKVTLVSCCRICEVPIGKLTKGCCEESMDWRDELGSSVGTPSMPPLPALFDKLSDSNWDCSCWGLTYRTTY